MSTAPSFVELLQALATSDEAVATLLRDQVKGGEKPALAALERMKRQRQRSNTVESALAVAQRIFLLGDTAAAVESFLDGVTKLTGQSNTYLWLAADGRNCLKPGGGTSQLDERTVGLPDDIALMQHAARTRKPSALSQGVIAELEKVSEPEAVAVPLISLQNFIGVLAINGAPDHPIDAAKLQSLTLACELVTPALAALVCKYVSGRQQHDPLTNLLVRRRFMPDLHRACLQSIKNESPLSLLFIDVDNFKEINDEFGHQAGDEVLRTVATLLSGTIRLHDSAYRFGGDELCVIAPGIGGDDALRLAERVCESVAANYQKKREGPQVTTSIGVAEFNATRMPAARDFTEAADRAVYEAKRAGRNRATIAPR